MPDDEIQTEAESRAADRLNLFSDAVVAIAITLLAIELPVPEGGTVPLFWESVRHNGSHYAAFLISFFVIAAAWRDHHDIFRYLTRVDSRLRMLNFGWLLMIVLNPFATRLLTAPGHDTLRGPRPAVRLLRAAAGAGLRGDVRDAGAHGLAPAGAHHPAAEGDQPRPAVLQLDPRLRAVDPGVLRHHLRLGVVDRGPAARERVALSSPLDGRPAVR
ncbi:MAG TPA: TMEM175 family protein [Streptosporangiaceae bacterium]|nr:TMEM175 family protein [Streptosporangiaceae bacterium]